MLNFLVNIRRQPDTTDAVVASRPFPAPNSHATPLAQSQKFGRIPKWFNRISRMQPKRPSRVPRTQGANSSNTTTYPMLILAQPKHRPTSPTSASPTSYPARTAPYRRTSNCPNAADISCTKSPPAPGTVAFRKRCPTRRFLPLGYRGCVELEDTDPAN